MPNVTKKVELWWRRIGSAAAILATKNVSRRLMQNQGGVGGGETTDKEVQSAEYKVQSKEKSSFVAAAAALVFTSGGQGKTLSLRKHFPDGR